MSYTESYSGERQQKKKKHTRKVRLSAVVCNIVDLGVQVTRAVVVTILHIEASLAIVKSQSVNVGVDITTTAVVDLGAEFSILLGLGLDVDVVVCTLLHTDADLSAINRLDIRVQGNIIVLSVWGYLNLVIAPPQHFRG